MQAQGIADEASLLGWGTWQLRRDIERKTLELISRENADIGELARSAEWHATLAQGHAQMEARAKEAANATGRSKMSGRSEKAMAELMAEYVPKVRAAWEADEAAKAEKAEKAAAAKAKVVQLASKTELSVEVQRERLERERQELIAAEKAEAARAAEYRRMADFHREQSHAHDAAARWAGEKIEVLEVDGEGRASRALRDDLTTNEKSIIEFDGGYRRSGVVSDYSPLDRLRRRDDE